MMTLFTGLPGNGKTLYALWYIAAKAKKENREVYYHNVKDLNPDALPGWQVFDPEKWMELPHGSMILIDECQEVFPRKPNGSQLPAHYEQLAKHRHHGFDIFLVTQHPTLIDNFVRKLVGQHFHSVRKFGLQRATIHEWSACCPAPENIASRNTAISKAWAYPKEVFGWYKSAEVHTVKRAIPAKLVFAVLFVVAVLVGGWWQLDRYQHRYDKKATASTSSQGSGVSQSSQVAGVAPGGGMSGGVGQGYLDPVADAKKFVFDGTPRVAGLPQTAPKYDEITKPTRVPVPAMCVQKGRVGSEEVSCRCFSQQATPLDVPFKMCMEFAANGWFEDFDSEHGSRANQSSPAVSPSSGNARGRDVQLAEGPAVVVIPEVERPTYKYHLTGATALK
jgi:zona occludens toxin